MLPVESGCDLERCFEVVDGLLRPAPRTIYVAKDTVASADQKSIAFIGEEMDRFGSSFFCGVELLVIIQRPSKLALVPLCCRALRKFLTLLPHAGSLLCEGVTASSLWT